MKKILIVITIALVILCAGCNNETTKEKVLDKETAINKIASITFSENDFQFSDESNINNTSTLEVYNIELDRAEDYLFYIPSDVVNPSMYLIIKPKVDEKQILQYQVNELFEKYYSAYNNYYPKEAKMIKEKLEKEYEGYLIYIVSYDNDKVLEAIKDSIK